MATLTQTQFRLRNDDGDEAGASWIAGEGEDATLYANKDYRVRFLITESAGAALSGGSLNLYYSTDGTNYYAAGAGTPIIAAGSKWYTHGASSTEQITSAGTFTAVNTGMANDSLTATASIGASEEAEIEYCFRIQHGGTGIKDRDTIYLEVYNGTNAISAYTEVPAITVRAPGGRRGG